MKLPDKLIKTLKTLPIFVATLGIIVWLSLSEEGDKVITQSYQPQSTPDLTLINSKSDHYNETGQVQYHLIADQIDHYKKDDMAYLTNPDLTSKQADSEWHATSLSGEVDLKTDQITLNDQVVINRSSADQSMKLRASTLTIHPNESIAENEVLTVITSGQSYVESKGFHTNLETGDTLLKSNVRGTHEVQK